MTELDLSAIAERYHRALDAKKGKGDMDADGIAAITDSVADIPEMLDALNRWVLSNDYKPEGVDIVMQQLRDLRAERDEIAEKLASISTGCLDLDRDQLIRRITAVGSAEWKAGNWLTAKMAPLVAERLDLREQNQRMASRLGGYATTMQEQLDPLFAAMGRVKELAEGWAQMFDNAITPEGEAVRDAGCAILKALEGAQ